ncbi:MAG: mannose-6-phosphate isomerase, class I [Actinomycetota bacterium]
MYTLVNPVKDYPWGSLEAIPRLLGVAPTGGPQAELWIGAHPAGPSRAITATGEQSLRDVISADPKAALGDRVAGRFGPELPFLLKVLSAVKPLSLQVHPSKEQAKKGYADEEAAGIPLDAPTRNFKDRNHKPELLFALTPFEALSGFKPVAESAALLRLLQLRAGPGGVLDDLLGDLGSGAGNAGLRAAAERLLTLDEATVESTVASVVVACGGLDDPAADIAVELNRVFPNDPGVVLALLLNRITLAPGDAIYLPAGNLHAYLRGTGIELMAASDNVLRGGLTDKHIDVAQLLAIVDFTSGPPMRVQPIEAAGRRDFGVPVDDFALSILDVDKGREVRWDDDLPRTAIVLEGSLELAGRAGAVQLGPGGSVFVAAADSPVVITGVGRLAVASPGT